MSNEKVLEGSSGDFRVDTSMSVYRPVVGGAALVESETAVAPELLNVPV